MPPTCRVLGIDTSLRSTGAGIVEACGSRLTSIETARIRNAQSVPHSGCLLHIHEQLTAMIVEHRPNMAAIEKAFCGRNVNTALILGAARGAAITACAAAGVAIYEYEPRRVKQAVVGYGGAAKCQMQQMVAQLLGLPEPPQEDIADALAMAICHLHTRSGIAQLMPSPI